MSLEYSRIGARRAATHRRERGRAVIGIGVYLIAGWIGFLVSPSTALVAFLVLPMA